MEDEVSVSVLLWSWVIEALAKSELVDTTLFYDLFSKASLLSGGLGKHTREAAALRCLEGLIGASNMLSENYVLSNRLKIGFNPTESCEAALQHILSETSGSKGASDELKQDVQSFLKHKKSCLPKSTLELLKNLILEDTHPLAASLKEFSGFAVRDQCVLNTPFDGGDPISPLSERDEDDHVDKTMFAEENGCSSSFATDDQPVEAYANGTSLPCRGGTTNHHTDIGMQVNDAASHDVNDKSPPGKKFKFDKEHGMKFVQPNSVPFGSNQMCNGVDNGQFHELIKTNRIHDVKLDRKDVDEQEKEYVGNHDEQETSPNHSNYCSEGIDLAMKNHNLLSTQCAFVRDPLDMTDSEPNSVPVGDNQMCNGVDNGQYREVIKTNRIHDGKLDRKDAEEKEKECVGNHDEQQTLPNDSDHCRVEVDLAMTDSEPNPCMKCNKSGQLLSCGASSCPLLFHESCLGSSVSFDDQGIFYCPFCAFSRAVSEYVKAKEKVSCTRKELSLFIGEKAVDQPEGIGHHCDTSLGGNVNQDIHENGKKRVEVEKGVNDRHKDVDKTVEVNTIDVVAQVAKPRLSNLRGNQVDLSNLPAHMNVSFEDNQGAEAIIQLSIAANQVRNQGQEEGAKLSDDNEVQSHGEASRCKITEPHGDASSESISDSDVLLQDKRNTDVHSLPPPKPLREIAPSVKCIKQKVPWTAEEEAMLKKGIEMFAQENQTIPWKNILEYGRSVFQKKRTAEHLKDKWKRMRKNP